MIQHIRPKLSCRACETIVQAPMPSLPIERGLPGPGLLAHIAIAKFCDHLPLHRQSAIYAREGVELDRALMADWMGKVVFLLTPLAEAIGRHGPWSGSPPCSPSRAASADAPRTAAAPRGLSMRHRCWMN